MAQEIKVDVTQKTPKWKEVIETFRNTAFHYFGGEGTVVLGDTLLRSQSFTVLFYGNFTNMGVMRRNRNRFAALRPEMYDYSVSKAYVSYDAYATEAIQAAFSVKADYWTMPGRQAPGPLTALLGHPPQVIIINDTQKVVFHGHHLPVIAERDWGRFENMTKHVTNEENATMKEAEAEDDETPTSCCCCGGCGGCVIV